MKRVFDIAVTLVAAVAWVPILMLAGLAVLITDGWPLLYVSPRIVFRDRVRRVVKFRTMRRDAQRVANRATVPYDGTRFLNLPPDSPLYTPIGRVLERCCFTELPQLFHVLLGHMSLVGNRPLPVDVFEAIRDVHPLAGGRFDSPAGLTGPVQLAGRERLEDEDRLRLETRYCHVARTSYSMRLDFLLLFYTVMLGARLHRPFTLAEVEGLLARFERVSQGVARRPGRAAASATTSRVAAEQEPSPPSL